MNKKLIIIFLILTIVLIIGIFIFTKKQDSTNKDALAFKEEYEKLNNKTNEKTGKKMRVLEIDRNNPFIYKDASEIIQMIENKETFVVYFGFSDCPWCRSVVPTLIKVADDLDIDKVYYTSVKEIRDVLEMDENNKIRTITKGTDDYYELIKLLDSVLENYTLVDKDNNEVKIDEKRIYAPNIVSIVKGKAEKMSTGISDEQTDPFMKLNDNLKKDMYDKIKSTMEVVLEYDMCSLDSKC